jgi:EAL domain-containing protein (putative c-di-GMP-specific phosphodiesterase class I)
MCRRRALEDAERSGLRGPFGLFINVEPAAATDLDQAIAALSALRERGVRPVLEITERALIDDPARLIAFAGLARAAGWRVALDDVGANSDSLTLMPFLHPEFIKLDLRLVQQRPDAAVAEIMTTVTAYAEQSGAHVVAEGIETEVHEYTARSLGATLGQGWRYGRPGPMRRAQTLREPRRALAPQTAADGPVSRSPYAAAVRSRTPQRGSKSLLIAVSKLLEAQAAQLGEQVVVLAAFQTASWFSADTARRYASLAASAALVVVLGEGVTAEPAPGVRGADLSSDDPMLGEWAIVVVAPHFAAAFVARDLDEHGPDLERAFDYVLTYDREIVLEAARSVMSRALPLVRV